jgi:uncharacterized protein (TIGR03545 family)
MPDGPPPAPTPGTKPGLVRWKALIPFALFLLLVIVGWSLFADRLGRLTVERGGTAILGARVDVRSFHISLFQGNVTIRGLVAASPFDSLKNLMEARELVADLDLLPLLEKKVVIDRLAANGLRFGTTRTTSGFVPSRGPSATSQIMANVRTWAAQPALQVPVLRLATGSLSIDSLDPRRLQTVQAAESLAARADSSWRAWSAAAESLDVKTTADSAVAFARRLQGARATDLRLIADARRTLDRVKQTRDRLTTLERGIRGGESTLDEGLAGLAAARQRDYAFARSLVKLPPIDASSVAWVLFGPAAIAKFQQALYYTRLAREYMPPGLQPRTTPAPSRRAGTTVRFPLEHELPGFLLRDAELSLSLGPDSALKSYSGQLQGLTSAPALYGRPTTVAVTAPSVKVDGRFDHVRTPAQDILGGTVRGVSLPAIRLPGLPIAVDPGRGDVSLGFALSGDSLQGRWQVSAAAATWRRDGAATGGSAAADLLWRVVSGIDSLQLVAELGGTVNRPTLHVRSNLDRAVADRLRAEIGDQVTAAEARVRAQVDEFVNERVTPVRAQVAKVTADANAMLAARRQTLDDAQQQLEHQLKRLTGGIRLP